MTKQEFEKFVVKTLVQLQQDVRRLEVLHEETDHKISAVIEIISPKLEQVNDHEARITKLEATA